MMRAVTFLLVALSLMLGATAVALASEAPLEKIVPMILGLSGVVMIAVLRAAIRD